VLIEEGEEYPAQEESCQEDAEIGEELFKHLSFLKELQTEVSPQQQIDAGDPGEYVINFSDSNSASPSSAQRMTNLMGGRKASVNETAVG
jgi:hypothetical protein